MSAAPAVEARALVKRYGRITAVDHVDLTVKAGDVYGYLGPNGAGKTTTLRMMLGLITPDAGTVKLFGRDPLVDGVRALDGVAGFVEAPRFYPYLNGRKNLELVAALDGGDAASRIDAALDTVELADRARDKVGGYSHGMRQRLGLAGALLRDPRLLILDEPATGLDPGGMRDMRLLIRRLADQGMTVLLSSHLMAEVEELCDRVVIISSGRVRYEGALDELIATTAGRYELRTTDDERAQQIAAAQRGIGDLERDARGLTFAAGERAATALSIALGEAGVGIAALVPRTATLEELFFRMTEEAPAGDLAPAGVSNDRRSATTDRHTPRAEEEVRA
ncbi:MAG: Efflux ABC transporter, ATP-binding protein [uncultured Solirubrobacteraceae bacterium]|uniref:Efflux ABC transporter, ATP-binding protein n=1 Tax=uncultured Solirubrobacteraceae bacterium TaxID=1162706 RepID=A0A6J4RQJ9_9ACTN|nr:MAG: Efflux ABC transporter, ATP-binding protein [uncultured Solirubrobacteraceae bacterium]